MRGITLAAPCGGGAAPRRACAWARFPRAPRLHAPTKTLLHARATSSASTSSGGDELTCTVHAAVEPSAKSFSYVPVRKRQVEAAEQAAQAAAAHHAPAPQSRVRYESISQFSQKVELYRGRCGPSAPRGCGTG
jgi:hypothetical protein